MKLGQTPVGLREYHRRYAKEYYRKNREQVLAKSRKWYATNREYVRECQKEYSRKNRKRAIARTKKWYMINKEKNRIKQKARQRKYRTRLKLEVIVAYGGRCVCCGESEPEFLTIDHTNHDGMKHRKTVGSGSIYEDLKRRGWPKDGFALKCMNCNFAEKDGRLCPHSVRRVRATGT